MAKTSKIVKNTLERLKFPVRHVNRCERCGRPRAFIRYFGLCRLCFRKMAQEGHLPGVLKASW